MAVPAYAFYIDHIQILEINEGACVKNKDGGNEFPLGGRRIQNDAS
jgi:hypothetical protein